MVSAVLNSSLCIAQHADHSTVRSARVRRRRHCPNVHGVQSSQTLLIHVSTKQIEVVPYSAKEEYGVLRNDSQPRPQIVETHMRDVEAVNEDPI